MKFGFIGAGVVAQTLAKHLLLHGHEVMLSNSRGPETLWELVSSLGAGAKSGTPSEAAEQDYVILSVGWSQVPAALSMVPDWTGRVIIDATNRFDNMDSLGDLSEVNSSEIVAQYAPGARVIKAFNTVPMQWIQDYTEKKPKTVLFVSGDDSPTKQVFLEIWEGIGFACIDLGSLSHGGSLQQIGGPLAGLNLNLLEKFIV
ncbi:NADPH-dependent F420 reductase [Paenibacillus sp. MAH-36]|uniref:NAD(P)-binding domain-containing protein n=1 Tax=Paenibacillus violae TaxID=3077234 RepID=A0ABU3R994_9BACL|nr:NAD(P)-binding domain-containing protein [Paenibacillus sp. PFR10]MDU0200848.1 NAD(P)-binding domain-containing protein [Paenibacillus sp. PFR10]